MNRFPVELPGAAGPVEVQLSWFGQAVVRVDGEVVPNETKRVYSIPMADGRVVEAKMSNTLTGLHLEVDGTKVPVGVPVPAPMLIVVMLPLVLVLVGGCFGGFCGGLAASLNMLVARQPGIGWPARS